MKRIFGTLAIVAALAGSSLAARANQSVTIKDDAQVLSAADRDSITQAAQRAPFGVTVWTANGGYAQNRQGFEEAANAYAGQDQVVIAVDPIDRFSHINANNARLSADATSVARTEANQSFGQRQWGAGVLTALGHLNSAVGVGTGNSRGQVGYHYVPYGNGGYTHYSSGGSGFGFLWILFLILGVVMLIRAFAGNRGGYGYGGGGWGRPGMGMGWGGGGGGGLMSGLLGGLLGYEIGRDLNQGGNMQGGAWVPDNGGTTSNDGGFVQSDFGGGNSPDFGGGADLGGGGADFGGGGGGASTDF